jgi:tetratricopeptide (TPR) repeat protein
MAETKPEADESPHNTIDLRESQGAILGNQGTISQNFGDVINTIGGDYVARDKFSNSSQEAVSRAALRSILEQSFSLDEIKALAFELGVDYDNIAGDSLSVKVRELIQLFERINRLNLLLSYIRKVRPNISFESVEPGKSSTATTNPNASYVELVSTLARRGQQALTSADYVGAISLFRNVLALTRSYSNIVDEVQALVQLGGAYRESKQFDQALDAYQQSLAIQTSASSSEVEPKQRVTTLRAISTVYVQQGQFDLAYEYLERSLTLARELQLSLSVADILKEIGMLLRTTGNLRSSLSYLERASYEYREANEELNLALTLNEIGVTLLSLGDYEVARRQWMAALELVRKVFSPQDEAVILNNVALLAATRADWVSAQTSYAQVIDLQRRLANRAGESVALANLATIHARLHEWDLALALYQQSLTLALRTDDIAGAATTLVNIGNIHLERNNLDAAMVAFQEAQRHQQTRGDQEGVARTREKINLIYRQREDIQRPVILLVAEAQRFFEKAGFRLDAAGDETSFVCVPVRSSWQKTIDAPVFARTFVGQRLTSNDVLRIRDDARNFSSQATLAFVVTDQDPKDDAIFQIITERLKGMTVVPVPAALLYETKSMDKFDAEYLALYAYLKDLMGGVDPYTKTSPVTDRMNFVGRDALAESLMKELVENGKYIGLFGLRKMGKSSLMRYMQFKMPIPTAWLDLQKGIALTSVFERALQGWQNDAQTRFGIDLGLNKTTLSVTDPSGDFIKSVSGIITTLKVHKVEPTRLAIFLDEIEQIMPSTSASEAEIELALKLMKTLRGLVQEDGTVTLMVAGVDPSVTRISRIGEAQNPFFQMLTEVYLPPISADACKQLVRNLGSLIEIEYTDDALVAIVNLSGGHPFFARRLCSLIYEKRDRRPGIVTSEDVAEAAEEFVFDQKYAAVVDENGLWGAEIGNTRIWTEPVARSSQRILESLSQSIESQTEPDLVTTSNSSTAAERVDRRKSLTTLNNLAVVKVDKPDKTTYQKQEIPRYQITFGLFRDWIRQVHLGLDPD